MDFDQYVAARYGRLIEHAVLLGCAEGQAGVYVDQVLIDNRRKIKRSADPDPIVHEALERLINGTPDRSSRGGPFVAVGLVGLVVAVAVALTYRPRPEPVPTLFGLTGEQAQQVLEGEGYDVVLRPVRACEPQGLVLGSDPAVGTLLADGEQVTVRTAVPSDVFCEAQYGARTDAWAFVEYALGRGPAPAFAPDLQVSVAGQPAELDAALARVRSAAAGRADTDTGMPRLVVVDDAQPSEVCGVAAPAGVGESAVLRFSIDPQPDGEGRGCPLTVDLHRTDGGAVVDAVTVYPPAGPDAAFR